MTSSPDLMPSESPEALNLALEVAWAPPSKAGAGLLIRAESDVEAAQRFLAEYRDSPNTLRSYRKEVGRFLIWCARVQGRQFSDVTRDDLDDLFEFYRNPPADWIQPLAVPRSSADWRPFKKPMSDQAIRHSRLVLHSMFDYLVAARYLTGNPLSLIRRTRRSKATGGSSAALRGKRRHGFGRELLAEVDRYIEALPVDTPKRKEGKLRDRLIYRAFIYTAGRLEEITTARTDKMWTDGKRWWLSVTGKGGKHADLPLPVPLLESLGDYREFHGISRLPSSTEDRPMFGRLGKLDAGIGPSRVYKRLKEIFAAVATELESRGDRDGADVLKRASTHWLRHSALKAVVDSTHDLRLAKRAARHESINTTAGYSTSEDSAFHDELSAVLTAALSGRSDQA